MFTMKNVAVVSYDIQSADQKICQWQCFTISEISQAVQYKIITVTTDLVVNRFCVKWVPKVPTGGTHNSENGFRFDFLEWYLKDGEKFAKAQCNRWWILGYICECWDQRAIKVVDAFTFTRQAEKG
jgi:hypothetical protein